MSSQRAGQQRILTSDDLIIAYRFVADDFDHRNEQININVAAPQCTLQDAMCETNILAELGKFGQNASSLTVGRG